jgi:hypothetical protein
LVAGILAFRGAWTMERRGWRAFPRHDGIAAEFFVPVFVGARS